MAQRTGQLVFFGLVIAVLGARTLWWVSGRVEITSSILRTIGGGALEILAAIVVGRIALWFAEKLALFTRNVLNPDTAKSEFQRTIWQTLSLSLVIGWPLFVVASQ